MALEQIARGRRHLPRLLALASLVALSPIGCDGADLPLQGDGAALGAGGEAGEASGAAGSLPGSAGSRSGSSSVAEAGSLGSEGGEGPVSIAGTAGGPKSSSGGSSGGRPAEAAAGALGGVSASGEGGAGEGGVSVEVGYCDAGEYWDWTDESCGPCHGCGTFGVLGGCASDQDTVCNHVSSSTQFGASVTNVPVDVTLDGAGNVWVTGFAQIDGDEGAIQVAFVRKFAKDGSEPLWDPFSLNRGLSAWPQAIAADQAGNVWVAGRFEQTTDGITRQDVFVRMYPSDGSSPKDEVIATDQVEEVLEIAVDTAGTVWIGGYTSGDLADPTALSVGHDSFNAFFVGYPADGAEPVVLQFGERRLELVEGVTIDGAGNFWVVSLADVTDLYNRLVLQRFRADGSVSFSDEFSGPHVIEGGKVAVDQAGNAWAAGRIHNSEVDGWDVFLRKYPVDGSAPTTDRFASGHTFGVPGMTLDAIGNVWLVGEARCNISGTPIPEDQVTQESDWFHNMIVTRAELCQPLQAGFGSTDSYLRLYRADGSELRTYLFGGADVDALVAVAPAAGSGIWALGYTGGDLAAPALDLPGLSGGTGANAFLLHVVQ